MAFNWANVLVAPTGSSALDTGTFADVDEAPPWNDTDEAFIIVPSLGTETPIFSGFDLSLAGGEKKGFRVWSRMRVENATGFDITLVVKQDTTTLWTSPITTLTEIAYRTYVIDIPDSAFSGNPDIDNLSLEWTCQNLLTADNRVRWSWLRMSKTPFTTAQEVVLPSSLVGQNSVVYLASDLGVLGAVDGESVVLIPDSTGKGRHAVLKTGSATYETDAPVGIAFTAGRFVGALGYDPATDAATLWSANKIFHAQVYPISVAIDGCVFSNVNAVDFLGGGGPGQKHLLACDPDGWTMMSGDGSAEAHLEGSLPVLDASIRVTEWVQTSGGNEKMWDNDDVAPTVNASSGDNPFGFWSIGDRESDNRPYIGRIQELWFIEGTGITEAELDTARGEWVNGIGGEEATVQVQIHRQRRVRVR